MSSFMSASIGRKFLMSITGLFLISFLCIHLTLNLFLTFDDSGNLFNLAAHFMATNPFIRIMEPLLAIRVCGSYHLVGVDHPPKHACPSAKIRIQRSVAELVGTREKYVYPGRNGIDIPGDSYF